MRADGRSTLGRAGACVALVSMLLAGCARSVRGEFAAAPSPRAIPAHLTGDYVALQGTWIVTHNELSKTVIAEMRGREFIFQDNQFRLDGGAGAETFVLDEQSRPKGIDFVSGSSVIKGIYMVQADALVLCTAPSGDERPTDFKTSRATRVILTELRRRR